MALKEAKAAQELFDELRNQTDVTPDQIRKALNDRVPAPSVSNQDDKTPDIALDKAINYFKLTRR